MGDTRYLPLQDHTEQFHLPKHTLFSIYIPSPPLFPQTPATTEHFTVSIALSIPECRIVRIKHNSFLRLASFTKKYAFKVLCVFSCFNSFFSLLKYIPLYDVPHFVHPFSC